MGENSSDKEREEISEIQREYYDRPFLKFIKSEGWIFLVAFIVVISFVIYKKYFQTTEIISEDNISKYVRVFNDFGSLVEDFENEVNVKREEKSKDERVRIDITQYKTRLYQIYDFMYVQRIAPENPFYKDYSKEEKELINNLMNIGKRIDKIVIEIYNFNGDPNTYADFGTIKRLLSTSRERLDSLIKKR